MGIADYILEATRSPTFMARLHYEQSTCHPRAAISLFSLTQCVYRISGNGECRTQPTGGECYAGTRAAQHSFAVNLPHFYCLWWLNTVPLRQISTTTHFGQFCFEGRRSVLITKGQSITQIYGMEHICTLHTLEAAGLVSPLAGAVFGLVY